MLCIARIDIAGGWTDTPPQAYEWGGKVVTLAIKINDEVSSLCDHFRDCERCLCLQNPIKCIATRIERCGVTVSFE